MKYVRSFDAYLCAIMKISSCSVFPFISLVSALNVGTDYGHPIEGKSLTTISIP